MYILAGEWNPPSETSDGVIYPLRDNYKEWVYGSVFLCFYYVLKWFVPLCLIMNPTWAESSIGNGAKGAWPTAIHYLKPVAPPSKITLPRAESNISQVERKFLFPGLGREPRSFPHRGK